MTSPTSAQSANESKVGRSGPATARRAFTLVELLVVIGIIVILISILVPVISKIRQRGFDTSSQQFIRVLASAIERYHQEQHAYPGPLADNEIYTKSVSTGANSTFPPTGSPFVSFSYPASPPSGFDTTSQTAAVMSKHITMSENLVLGLLGGLRVQAGTGTFGLIYDPSAVGNGPMNLNTLGMPTRMDAFTDARNLSWQNTTAGKTGRYQDPAGYADDSIIPEFVDMFPDAMPILYLRAKVGANPVAGTGTFSDNFNPVITFDSAETQTDNSTVPQPAPRAGQYDLSQIIAYTGSFKADTNTPPNLTLDTANPPTGQSIGVGKSMIKKFTTPPASGTPIYHGLQSVGYTTPNTAPYTAYTYFRNSGGVVQQKDAYILIGAGIDRVYGTSDDDVNFGSVGN